MSIMYRWSRNQMFYLHSNLDVAYHVSAGINKQFMFACLTKRQR